MTRPRLFIASSSEGLPEAQALLHGLQARLGDSADVRLWTSEFGLSRTYIEALEQQSGEADFAVAVFSPDDRITSRARRQQAPRDNVIFELGLFIGALGRPRCFVVHRKDVALKLPSDLLAVVSADFVQAPGQALADALAPRCEQIAQRVRELGALRRISPAALVRREQSLAMAARLRGDWWERINGPGQSAISFVRIDFDETQETLRLRGRPSTPPDCPRRIGPALRWSCSPSACGWSTAGRARTRVRPTRSFTALPRSSSARQQAPMHRQGAAMVASGTWTKRTPKRPTARRWSCNAKTTRRWWP